MKRTNTAWLDCMHKCQLKSNGSIVQATITKISIDGVRIHVDGPLPDVRSNSTCSVLLGNDHINCQYEFPCDIVSVSAANFTLRFTTLSAF